MANSNVRVYGADWCGDTIRAKRHLERKGVEYEFIDVDQDERASEKVIGFNKGKRRIPMIEIGETTLSVPSAAELDKHL